MLDRLTKAKAILEKTKFDLIIIGGGINGCGIARDASERGLKVLLLEKNDFGSGCTSASTRLIHGGLRYLEHFEFDLVRESIREREFLLKNAKHLVKPLELCIPIYKKDKRSYWHIKAGMLLYDFLSFDKSLPSHKMFSNNQFAKYEGAVKKENLTGGALYYDAQCVFPERICLENILMAVQMKAFILNYAQVNEISIESNKISTVNFVDCLTNKPYSARGKVVVNASGPWVDVLCGLTNRQITRKIGGTKGSHIVVKKYNNGPTHAIYASARSDSRPFFIIPWQSYYLIGTTDISYTGDLDHLKISHEEINYLLSESNNILEGKTLTHNDIVFSYAGVRPLPHVIGSKPQDITRRHMLFDHKEEGIENFISIVGGKLTTYRSLSEKVVDKVFEKLGYETVLTKTKDNPLIGSTDEDLEFFKSMQIKKYSKKHDLDADIITHLINLYGKRYKYVIDLILKEPDMGYLLSSLTLDIRAQVKFAIQHEMAFTISDVLLRRTTLGLNVGLGKEAINEISRQFQLIYAYSNDEIKKQVIDYNENIISLR